MSLFHLMKYNFGNCLPDHEYLRTQLQELILAVHLILLIRSRKPYHIVSKMMKCNVKISRCSPSLYFFCFLYHNFLINTLRSFSGRYLQSFAISIHWSTSCILCICKYMLFKKSLVNNVNYICVVLELMFNWISVWKMIYYLIEH